jgi:hypothetical protein
VAAIHEFAQFLVSKAHGPLGSSLFLGLLPESPDVCRAVVPTGGPPPVHEFGGVLVQGYRFQLFIRDTAFAAGYGRALQMYEDLKNVSNVTVTGGGTTGFFARVDVLQPPYLLERDGNGRVTFGFNVEVVHRPVA